MKDRMEEYRDLVSELAHPPEQLEDSVHRARKRAQHTWLRRRFTAPISTLAAAAACFILMVNLFPTFALACSGVPVIRELAAAAAFSPSLSAAVAHDYVQYIGQSQTVDGVKVELGYAIVDRYQTVFFYSVDGGRFYTSPEIIDENGERIGGYATSTVRSGDESGLDSMTISFSEQSRLPERFTMKLFFMPDQRSNTAGADAPSEAPSRAGAADDWTDPRNDPGTLCFTFDVTLDPNRIVQPIQTSVNRWLELDGQRILVDRLEYTPTRTVLYLGEDSVNTAWLGSLKFWFEDEQGCRYDNMDGVLSASGAKDSKSTLTYYFQSFYYNPPKGLTLCVDKIEWLDKDMPHALVDLTTGEASGLPEGAEIGDVRRTGNNVELEVWSPLVRKYFAQSFEHTYWDPEGGEHEWNQISSTIPEDSDDRNGGIMEVFYLNDYPWDSVELAVSYTSVSEYAEPVHVPLTSE
jgi:hypothetical protein